MLPKSHFQAYQEFLTVLLTLRDRATDEQPNVAALQKNFERVQQIFQGQIMSLDSNDLDPSIVSKWQSVQTEVYRSLRLLGTDLIFLQSSRRAVTSEQRLTAVRDRLEQLIGYCQAMLQ